MSAYRHGTETEHSASGEESDNGSEFRMESVMYVSSAAATIFIVGLLVAGVLLLALLIALIVMLQSCQTRNSGALEMSKSIDQSYDYCRTATLHAELNSFELYSLPEFCTDLAVHYIKDGRYTSDLSYMVSIVEDYFKNVTPVVGGRDVVLMDLDDLLPSDSFYTNPMFYRFHHDGYDDGDKEAKHVFLLEIYTKLRSGGWPLVLLSREPEKQQPMIVDKLIAARFEGWSKLIMRSDEEMKIDTRKYFFKQKAIMQAKGYHIRAVISSRMDALVGPFIGTRVFKLPNPSTQPLSMIDTQEAER
ncbi:uncharacterized protein At2g39920-like [Cynara cardunculus var. scolymus]|uniref:uncharacterized protein At2g39920-like n=1 Tax=Cynara cardunculus var. scolymus TaxID=59895 RepID=UPI000D624ECE|nr:uncharacterized protein At2g39920-like [Cynara cardunculus var. scolymus]XP_024991882.1 uncharacterized protein At2g39920-like [Cynara cardunculus var. scolymus]